MPRQHAAAAAIFVVLAILMTWPLAPRLNHVAADPSDPFINIWILDWDHYATFHRPFSLFDANIFYPTRDSLAFSENLYGIALLLIPFRAVVSAVTAYNIAMLGGFAFSGFAAYLLGVRLTGSFIAGIAAGAAVEIVVDNARKRGGVGAASDREGEVHGGVGHSDRPDSTLHGCGGAFGHRQPRDREFSCAAN